MTAEGFLDYIGSTQYYFGRDKGKARLNRAKQAYRVYIDMYREPSLSKLCSKYSLARGTDWYAACRAVEDRENGVPMVNVPELL